MYHTFGWKEFRSVQRSYQLSIVHESHTVVWSADFSISGTQQ